MTALSSESRALFRSARSAMSPADGARDRVRARLAAKVGAAAVGAATGATIAKAAAGATTTTAGAVGKTGATTMLLLKIAGPVLVAGAAVVAAPRVAEHVAPPPAPVVLGHVDTARPIKQATAPLEAHVPPAAKTVDANALPDAPATSGDRTPRARTSAKPAQPNEPVSAEEAMLVDGMDRALRSGDPQKAAALATEHERKFPRGTLAEEREGARVLARCMTGVRSAEAASTFLAAHPRSPMRARILAACATSEAP